MDRREQPVLGAAVDRGAALGVARVGAHRSTVAGGLATRGRASSLFSGDVRRSVAAPGDVLSGGQLDRVGADVRAGTPLSDPTAKSIGEAGARLPTGEAISRAFGRPLRRSITSKRQQPGQGRIA